MSDTTQPPEIPTLGDARVFLNRELSWLDFNDRVLALAEDRSLPLLERVRFLAIFSSNLDEFFQVRVAGLNAQIEAGVVAVSPDGRTPDEQLDEIRTRVLGLVAREEDLFVKELVPELDREGIRLASWESMDDADRAHLAGVFEQQIFPVLTPLSVDPSHPFPQISNLSLNLAVVVNDDNGGAPRFARLKVPQLLPRFLILPDGERFIPVEQVIAAHLSALFPGSEVVAQHPFRVTLDADLAVEEDEAGDLLEAIESGLHRRLRMNDVVRLEVDAGMSDRVRDFLIPALQLEAEDVYARRCPLDLSGLLALCDLDRPELKESPWRPITQPRLQAPAGDAGSSDIFSVLREGDVLVHHPYDSFSSSVEAFLAQAAADDGVLAIKTTLYRTSGPENPIVRALSRAAQAGKEVIALVELQARFDEESNIEWARSLEQAGVHVVYGLAGLKTHGKITLIVRREGASIRRYCHLGTGNYNPSTARGYEDLGLFTASPTLGADIGELFNQLTGCSRPSRYRKLLVAPTTLRPSLLAMIRSEMQAPDGRIVMKMNSLSDPEIITALYEASQAGVEIDLIVRGICCLRPGVPNLSERIRVRSNLGRFLEHSRIFRFGSAARGPRYFIGSADLMTRNLDARVEVVTPVEDPELVDRIEGILSIALADDRFAWELEPDGGWCRIRDGAGVSGQVRLQSLARERATGAVKRVTAGVETDLAFSQRPAGGGRRS